MYEDHPEAKTQKRAVTGTGKLQSDYTKERDGETVQDMVDANYNLTAELINSLNNIIATIGIDPQQGRVDNDEDRKHCIAGVIESNGDTLKHAVSLAEDIERKLR